ncbi:acyl-CoA dehydrogenase family protein [Kribbella sandramycini]|uniref:Acyl-CoA dehydrogenase family protein n=1 Tax=Kribbella sandramycini TaxID=60450 RepID=A0A7Y4L1V0_9ACTN|nr:acyl-CoA dehydrogenase family protein [Kribbella sandramycini]MBB6566581.1 alkylation response protein AidB-like acyl-CoA dehydrogenase [Kribbella sandramycini]NOL42764.1 acyl-CoA dehydrogenase family protein [Kribbella sandramycini]
MYSTERVRYLARNLARGTAADRDRRREWDEPLFKALTVPDTFGGELTAVQTCGLLAALAEGSHDPGLALAVTTSAVLTKHPLRTFGTPAQRERYLQDESLGGLSLQQTRGMAATVSVRADDAGWRLSGALDLVALGPKARYFLVLGEHDDGSRTAFVLDADTPGLRLEEIEPAALRTCPWGRVTLVDCQVSSDAVLGTVGGAAGEVEPLLTALDWVFTSAPWLGVLRALAEEALETVRTREVFGAPLAHSQAARFALADIAIQNELAAGLLDHAAAQFDGAALPSHQDAASARLFFGSAVRAVIDSAAQLAGPGGSELLERAHRDSLFFTSSGGGAEVLRPVIAGALLGLGGLK